MRLCFAGSLPAPGLPVPNRNQAQHQFAAATMLCRCYQGTSSAPCISISSVLCFVFSGKHFHSTTKDDVFEVAIFPPPKQWWHSPQVLRLVTLQCTVFYSLGLEPDPLCTPAGRPGLAITSLPLLFVCCIHLGFSEQAVYLLSGRVCAWFPVCAASQA